MDWISKKKKKKTHPFLGLEKKCNQSNKIYFFFAPLKQLQMIYGLWTEPKYSRTLVLI